MQVISTSRKSAIAAPVDALLVIGLAGIGLATLVSAVATLFLPFGWDHGILAAAGSPYVTGGTPYLDSWDLKGPAAYLPFAFAEALFGKSMWGPRLVDLAFWALAGGILVLSLRDLIGWKLATWTALAIYLWVTSAGWLFTAQPESWVTASAIIAIVPLLARDARLTPARFVLCGFLIGCCGLVKPFYFALGAAPLVFLACSAELGWPRRVMLAIALGIGALAPPALAATWFALRGGFDALIEVHLLWTLSSYVKTDLSAAAIVAGVATFVLKAPIVLTAPFALVGLWARRHDTRLVATLLTWFAVALFCVALQMKFYVYHWFAAYPPLFILGALGLDHLLGRDRQSTTWALVALAGAGLILAATVVRPVRDVVRLAQDRIMGGDSQAYYGTYSFRLYNAADEIAAARYIAGQSAPEDRIYVWGSDATVAYLSGLPAATRFTLSLPLTEPSFYRDVYRQQAMAQLTANPPRWFVLGMSWTGEFPSKEELADFPELQAFWQANYALDRSFGIVELYRLKDAPPRSEQGAE